MSQNYNSDIYKLLDSISDINDERNAVLVSSAEIDYWNGRLNQCISSGEISNFMRLLLDIKDVAGLNELKTTIKLCIEKFLQNEKGDSVHSDIAKSDCISDGLSASTNGSSTLSKEGEKLPAFAQSIFGKGEGTVDTTFSVDILPSVVGWVIGRSGSRIKEIQTTTGCRMWVDQDVPGNQARKLFFHGPKSSIITAYALVNKLLESAPVLCGDNFGVDASTVCSAVIDCPADKVGLLIGRKGWTIKKIMSESGAQISINQSVREGCPRKVIVSGTKEATEMAEKYINMILGAKFDDINSIDSEDARMAKIIQLLNSNGNSASVADASTALNHEAVLLMKQFEDLRFLPSQSSKIQGHHQPPPAPASRSVEPLNNPIYQRTGHGFESAHAQYFDNLMVSDSMTRTNPIPSNVNRIPLRTHVYEGHISSHTVGRPTVAQDSRVPYSTLAYKPSVNTGNVDVLSGRSVLANGAYLPVNYDRHADYRF